jgi:N utilization substance protein B
MTLPKQKFREIVFLALFALDLGSEEESAAEIIMSELKVTKKAAMAGFERAHAAALLKEEFDKLIAEASSSYDLERIPNVEKNVMRLSLYEMFHDDEIPPKVAIAEACRLTHKFSSPESVSFVNALLDKIMKKTQ